MILRRIAGLLGLALGLTSCNETSEGPDPNDHLTGNLQFVYMTFDTGPGEFVSGTAALSFNGDGEYSSDWTGPQMSNREGGLAVAWIAAGTYRLDEDRQRLTLDSIYSGGLSGDQLFINGAANAGGSPPSFFVAIRRQAGLFYAEDLSGNFHLLSFAHIVAGGNRQSLAGQVTFDGSGSWSGAADFNDGGALTAAQAIDGTYSLNNDGNFSINGMIGEQQAEGAFRDLGLTAVAASSNEGNDPRVYLLIKEASGLSDADLVGTYYLGGLIAGGTNVARSGTIRFDGQGGFTSSFSANDEGTVTTGNESGTYAVAANGRVTLVVAGGGPTYTGAVRPDGAFGAVAGVTDTEAPALLTFTRK